MFETIFDKAKVYYQSELDLNHMKIALKMAEELTLKEGGNKKIIIPAIIMHDMGWQIFSEEEKFRIRGVGGRLENVQLRHKHEVEGAVLAEKILSEINYPEQEKALIVQIIIGHDTRTWPLSHEDMIVKDADKLSRYYPEHIDQWSIKFKKNPKDWLDYLNSQIEKWLFTDTAKFMARRYILQKKLGILNSAFEKGLSSTFYNFLIRLECEIAKLVEEHLRKIIILAAKEKAYDVKKMIELYLADLSSVDVYELQKDEEFCSIATQMVGEKGYIGIIDIESHRIVFHQDKRLLNLSEEELEVYRPSEYLHGFWEWHERAIQGEEFYSYYQGMNINKEVVDKFQYVVPLNMKNIRWAIVVTADYDDFFKPIDILNQKIVQSTNEVLSQIGIFSHLLEERTKKLEAEVIERKQAEEELKVAQNKLIQSERLAATAQIASEVAHEIRNPLAVIKAGLFYLNETIPKKDDSEDAIFKMYAAVDRASSYLSELLNFSKALVINLLHVNINEIIEQVIKEIPYKTLFSEVAIIKGFASDLPLLNADPERLKQVFVNIIKNAAESMVEVENKRLEIKTQQEENKIKITIADTGKGISEENLKHIFDPFFTTKGKGTGLGLAVCHRFIDAHKGEIRVESKVGEGTTFIIKLPI